MTVHVCIQLLALKHLLEHFNWELFDCPPYSPDLVPNDYHLHTASKIVGN
jgi:hypothetical protein